MPTTSRSGSTSPTTGCRTWSLRARYDSERHPGRRRAAGSATRGRLLPGDARRGASPAARSGRGRRAPPRARPAPLPGRARPAVARRVAADRVRRLDLALPRPTSWRPSRASGGLDALPPKGRWDAATRDAVLGYAHELLLGPFLDAHLSEPFRERVRERLARAGSRRSTSRGTDRTRRSSLPPSTVCGPGPADLSRLAVAAASPPVTGPDPWPRGLSPADDDALRVISGPAGRTCGSAGSRSRRSCGARSGGRCTGRPPPRVQAGGALAPPRPWDGVILRPGRNGATQREATLARSGLVR